ncbi:hypothetical protein KAJ27_22120 [bacterium]|nr:hypothetical protein [bacterium]
MKVIGTAIRSIPAFILNKFGSDSLQKWINSLVDPAKTVYSSGILSSRWYPLKEVLVDPCKILCDLFFDGNIKVGAFELGSFSAEYSLTSVYKSFLKEDIPYFIIEKASSILPTYYTPCSIEIVDSTKNKVLFRIIEFDEIHRIIEYRIQGWMEKGLEICKASNGKVKILHSMLQGEKYTEFLVTWD